MSVDMLDQLFTPFYTTKELGKGLGLGLFNAQRIAKQHGGELLGMEGPGGRFLLKLPLIDNDSLSRSLGA